MARELLVSIICFLHFTLIAQPREWVSTKQYGGANTPTSISTDREGNVFITGLFRPDDWKGGTKGCIISKYCPFGELYWTDTITSAINIKGSTDADGNIYTIGLFKDSIRIGKQRAKADGYCSFIAKHDSRGECKWIKPLPRISPEDIEAGGEGEFYIVGKAWKDSIVRFDDHSVKGKAFFVARYSPNGECQWVKNASFAFYSDTRISLAIDEQDNVYAAGHGAPAREASGFAAKYDKVGNALWVAALPAIPRDIAADNTGNIFLAGHFTGSITIDTTTYTACEDCTSSFIMKLDNGRITWAKVLEGERTLITSIAVNTEGDAYVTGTFYENMLTDGAIAIAADGTNIGSAQLLVARLSGSGNLEWARNTKAAGTGPIPPDCRGIAICTSSTRQLYIAGMAGDTTIFGNMLIEGGSHSSLLVMGINDTGQAHENNTAAHQASNEVKTTVPKAEPPSLRQHDPYSRLIFPRDQLKVRREFATGFEQWQYTPSNPASTKLADK